MSAGEPENGMRPKSEQRSEMLGLNQHEFLVLAATLDAAAEGLSGSDHDRLDLAAQRLGISGSGLMQLGWVVAGEGHEPTDEIRSLARQLVGRPVERGSVGARQPGGVARLREQLEPLAFRVLGPTSSVGVWHLDLVAIPRRDSTIHIPLSDFVAKEYASWRLCDEFGVARGDLAVWARSEYMALLSWIAAHNGPVLDARFEDRGQRKLTRPDVENLIGLLPLLAASGRRAFLPKQTRFDKRSFSFDWNFSPSSKHFTLNAVCTFDWSISLGDAVISESELRRAVALHRDYLDVAGELVAFDPERAKELLDVTQRLPSVGSMDVLSLLEALQEVDEVESTTGIPTSTDLLARLLTGELGAVPLDALPVQFGEDLRPYQVEGVEWMLARSALDLGVLLADDMGLGKTRQVVVLIATERLRQDAATRDAGDCRGDAPTLVVCPAAMVRTWAKELRIAAPRLRVLSYHGADRSAVAVTRDVCDVVVTTYATLAADIDRLSGLTWDRLVLDEAQSIKNPRTTRFNAVYKLACRARHRVAITGTPIENSQRDLQTILTVVNPRLLPRLSFYESLYSPDSADRSFLNLVMLRRTKEDVAPDLPKKIEVVEHCVLTKAQVSQYQAEVERLLEVASHVAGGRSVSEILESIRRLKLICNHPSLLVKGDKGAPDLSGKVIRLLELVESALASEGSVLVFTQYVETAEMIARFLRLQLRQAVDVYEGSLSQSDRDEVVQRLQNGQRRVLVISLLAGGVGITLTGANHVIHFDRWWNPAVENQATDRAHRIGQTRTVYVHKLMCVGTIEQNIDNLLAAKREVAASIITPTGDLSVGALSIEDLADLVRYQP